MTLARFEMYLRWIENNDSRARTDLNVLGKNSAPKWFKFSLA